MSQIFGTGGTLSELVNPPLGDLTSDELIERRRRLAALAKRGPLPRGLGSTAQNQLEELDSFAPRLVPEGPGTAALGASDIFGRRTARPGGAPARGNRLGCSRGNIFKQRLGR